MEMADEAQLRKELVAAVHYLHAKGWAPATSSNYSVKPAESEAIWISRSGIDKGMFGEEHLMRVDMYGKAIDEPGARSSAETLLHTLIYGKIETGAVLHTHTVYNTVLSLAHESEGHMRLTGYEMQKAIEGISDHRSVLDIPVFSNSQDMVALSAEILEYWQAHPEMKAFLLAGHGLYTWGKTIAIARRQVEALEFLFECYYKRKRYGNSIHP